MLIIILILNNIHFVVLDLSRKGKFSRRNRHQLAIARKNPRLKMKKFCLMVKEQRSIKS